MLDLSGGRNGAKINVIADGPPCLRRPRIMGSTHSQTGSVQLARDEPHFAGIACKEWLEENLEVETLVQHINLVFAKLLFYAVAARGPKPHDNLFSSRGEIEE